MLVAKRRTSTIEHALNTMVRRIVHQFRPESVILFGSHAGGEARVESDVDLLVVMPIEGLKHRKQVEIRLALDDIKVPKDIIVTAPEDLAWRKDIVGHYRVSGRSRWQGPLCPNLRERARVVAEWITKAEEDLQTAAHT